MPSIELTQIVPAWKAALRVPRFRYWFLFSLTTVTLLIVFVESYFHNVILNRPGILLNDPILNNLGPYDWSLFIMTLIYSGILLSVAFNLHDPWNFLLAISGYAVVTWMRMFSMYYLTLEPPVGVIPLTDPFLAMTVYQESPFVKDLFFSGHVSSMCVVIAVEKNKLLRIIFIIMTLFMTLFILWQHVHYTIDVVIAPIASFATVAALRKWFLKKPLTD